MLEVREFQPIPGDSVEKIWAHDGEVKTVVVKPYAIIDMHKAAIAGKQYLDESVGKYVTDTIPAVDQLIQDTYLMAYKQATESEASEPVLLYDFAILQLNVYYRNRKSENCFQVCFASGSQPECRAEQSG